MNNMDLFDQAENAVETKPEYRTWGQAFVEMYEAVWPKGASAPERFDATIHNPADRFIRIEIAVVPLGEMNAKFNTEFKGNVTGWNNRDWVAVVLPSIKALGVSAREIPGKFVQITKKPNGKFYEKKKDGVKTGERAELTDFLFTKIFPGHDECLADYLETKAGSPVSGLSDTDFPAMPESAPAVAPAVTGPTTIPDETLLKFIRSFAVNAAREKNKDLAAVSEKVQTQIDANPAMKGKFSVTMPEIMGFIAEACQ